MLFEPSQRTVGSDVRKHSGGLGNLLVAKLVVHPTRAILTRRDLVKAISPNRRGRDKSAWHPKELSRGEAESVVKAVFEEITEALNRGETVKLPFGKFEVKKHNRPPLRGWFLNRVRVTYRKRRKYIEFTPGEGLPGGVIRRGRRRP